PTTFISRISFSIIVMAEFVVGNFANGFVALVNCFDWAKRKKISSADGILTALVVSRICLLWIILINWYLTVLNPALCSLQVRVIVYIAWAISNHFSIWLATILSIYYLFKIANFSSLIFLHLKWKVKWVLLVILLGSLFFLSVQVAVVSLKENTQRNEYGGNITQKTKLRDILQLSHVTVITLANLIPFTMSLISFLLLIFSLWKHLKKMKRNAMQTVISFLLLFTIYFLTLVGSVWSSKRQQNKQVLLLFQAFGILHPSVHSFILIWGNRKLTKAFLSVLWLLRCWLKERK
uniref:Taste receptor type 2 n=1 Tax=Catagonus wagneri TaxID=51154 RepID=A0A8C3YHG2_9CETA